MAITLPTLFIGHGSPMNAIETNRWTDEWTKIGLALPRPKAILSILGKKLAPLRDEGC